MKLAMTIWNERIAPVCDVAGHLLNLEVEDGRVTRRHESVLAGSNPVQKALCLQEAGAVTLICGAISMPLLNLLTAGGMRVIPFVAGSVEQVLKAYLEDRLPSPGLAMPGCQRWRHPCCATPQPRHAVRRGCRTLDKPGTSGDSPR
jgi:predicted Fe-Mo cluster-binding NifX family protein